MVVVMAPAETVSDKPLKGWWETVSDEFQTVSSSIPKELVPLLDAKRGTKTRSKYIRELIESAVSDRHDMAESGGGTTTAA